MEGLPFLAVCVAAVLYWKQFLAIFGKGPEKPRWKLEPKKRPLAAKYLVGIIAAIGFFGILPYAEELVRCYRAEKRRVPAKAA